MLVKFHGNPGWIILGDIIDVDYQYIAKTGDQGVMADEHYEAVPGIGEVEPANPERLLLLCKRKNGRTVAVKSDFPIYLLNDEGKTIEKL